MILVRVRDQPGGRTGRSLNVDSSVGCIGHHFTVDYDTTTTDPYRVAAEAMLTRLRRRGAFDRDEHVEITRAAEHRNGIDFTLHAEPTPEER